jgi:hypothetical protein
VSSGADCADDVIIIHNNKIVLSIKEQRTNFGNTKTTRRKKEKDKKK